jgi:hypothetical protein
MGTTNFSIRARATTGAEHRVISPFLRMIALASPLLSLDSHTLVTNLLHYQIGWISLSLVFITPRAELALEYNSRISCHVLLVTFCPN